MVGGAAVQLSRGDVVTPLPPGAGVVVVVVVVGEEVRR
jgi:hypothetical protein